MGVLLYPSQFTMKVQMLYFLKKVGMLSVIVLLTVTCRAIVTEEFITPQTTATTTDIGVTASISIVETITPTVVMTTPLFPTLESSPKPLPPTMSPIPSPTTASQEQLNDEERATQEAQAYQATIEAGTEAGELSNQPEELACAAEVAESPSLYLLCGNEIVPAPASISFIGAETLVEAEALLTSYVYELLGEVSATNESAGYESYFSDPDVLKALILTASGEVILDFNEKFAEQHGQLHGSTAARMLEQLNRTIFQFREVNNISVTLNGSCETFAQLFEFSCVNLDRDTWQRMLELNSDQVETFNLLEE